MYDSYTDEPIEGISVGVFSYYDYSSGMDYKDLLGILKASGITDSDGEVFFEKLSFGYYGIMVYYDEDNYHYDYYEFTISDKGEEETVTWYY